MTTVALLLAAVLPYSFRAELETVHAPNRVDGALLPAADEFVFRDGCRVPDEDFADYLSVSMGVKAVPAKPGEPGLAVRLAADATLRPREYAVAVGKDGVDIRAADDRALHQALYHLEDLMNLRRAPFLKFGAERRRMRFAS